MRRRAILLGCCMVVTACTSTQYGSFVAVNASSQQQIVHDAVQELVKIAPPAKTHLVLSQRVQDGFGRELISALRKKGYGIEPPLNSSGLPFYYILDKPINKSLYRITLGFGQQRISRAYVLRKGVLLPRSSWIRKE